MKCNVCQRDTAVGVASSTLGPVSLAYCQECLAQNADPVWLIRASVEMCDGVENVAEWVKNIKSYHEGNYISFEEVVGLPVPFLALP